MKDKYIDLIEQTFDFPQDEFTVEDNELNFHDIPLMELINQGVLFNDYKDLNTQIMLSSSKKAEDQEDQWIVDENSTILTTIFEKANKVWNLGLK